MDSLVAMAAGVLIGAVPFGALFIQAKRDRDTARQALLKEPLPVHWVGITRYEGSDPKAADAAFLALRDDAERIPGEVEQMAGSNRVRHFRIV